MKVLVSAICEHAWVENGCLNVCRTFDTINAPAFPYTLPRFSIALRFLFRRSEAGSHKLVVSLADMDGKKLMNSELNFEVNFPEDFIAEATYSVTLNGQNIIIPKAGDYVADIVVDARAEASIPLYAREKKAAP